MKLGFFSKFLLFFEIFLFCFDKIWCVTIKTVFSLLSNQFSYDETIHALWGEFDVEGGILALWIPAGSSRLDTDPPDFLTNEKLVLNIVLIISCNVINRYMLWLNYLSSFLSFYVKVLSKTLLNEFWNILYFLFIFDIGRSWTMKNCPFYSHQYF